MAKLTQQELERHLWGAADILRGTVDAGDYKQYIFGLLFYKRLCDVWDEEYEKLLAETGDREEAVDPDEHRFHIPTEHRWDAMRQQSTQIGQRLNNALAAIEDANLRLRGVFGSVDFANQDRFSDALLEKLLAHFEKHRLRNADAPADMLGDAYLYLIKMFAEGAGKKGGEFYTPRSIVRLMVEIIDPRPGMSVYDPTCGSAGMLLEAVQYLKDRGEDARSLSLYGQEKNFATWGIAEINLFLHDVDDAFIAKGDTILSPKRYDPKAREFVEGVGAYDRVLANPPFSEKVWGYEVWQNGDPFGRDDYGCPPKGKGDFAFIQHMIASLKTSGVLAVVLPHGVLFRGGAERSTRAAMLSQNIIEAVIGLPPNLFYGATLPACIVIFNRARRDRKGVFFINAVEEFRPGDNQNEMLDYHVERVVAAYKNAADIEHFARFVSFEEIANRKFSLAISRYVHPKSEDIVVDVSSDVNRLEELLEKRRTAEQVMQSQLSGLVAVSGSTEEWDEAPLEDLAHFIGRGASPTYSEELSGIWAISQKCVKDGAFEMTQARAHDPSKKIKENAWLLPFDICINSTGTGTLGRVALWNGHAERCFADTHITIVRPKQAVVVPKYLCEFLSWSPTTVTIYRDCVTGSTNQIELGKSAFSELICPLPPPEVQLAIARVLASIDDAIAATLVLARGSGNSQEGHLRSLKRTVASALFSRQWDFSR
jgi:type I restriction enzyme M protein